MNDNVSPLWPQSHESGVNGGPDLNEDFSSFLNFNDMPLGLSSPFDSNNHDGASVDPTSMDTDFHLGGHEHSATADAGTGHRVTNVSSAEELMNMQFHDIEKRMHEVQHQQFLHQQQHGMNHGGMVPPTPTSMELHGGLPQSTLHGIHSHMMMDRFNTFRDDPMIFTPLVSPAVTPLETEFRHIPEYAMPGAFSPLTSPMLEAYQQRSHMPNPHMIPMPNHIDPSQSPNINKKGSSRRKSTTRNPARVVRESPSMKPQKKRAPLPVLAAPKNGVALVQQMQARPMPSNRQSVSSGSQASTPMQLPTSQDVSSNESVSPEPLPEVLMAPPPPRSSTSRSPQEDDPRNGNNPHNQPVTPASLMKLAKTNLPTEDIPPISMDTSEFLNRDIQRGDIDSKHRMNGDDMTTPTMHPSRTPSLTPSLRPSGSVATSGQTSPQQRPIAPNSKKPVPRKRGSVSSSPALQPKISPSIKPLLPQGMSPDASALLLASKSNYQNIVEGNHSHLGLQYPEHLSTNLTSKRTSHKIAEQGRRNRINTALAEMATLLPPSVGSAGSDGGGSAAAREQTSKASTVESAIDYIKQLKAELEETKTKLEAAEEKLQDCEIGTMAMQNSDVGADKPNTA
ncbi:hypothetical protein EDC01DRAFT_629619 [Geopyxis carbonaria]|nr:hypothetical protein EDC01DRAFT_629619 [Geopyxis carbonaria]